MSFVVQHLPGARGHRRHVVLLAVGSECSAAAERRSGVGPPQPPGQYGESCTEISRSRHWPVRGSGRGPEREPDPRAHVQLGVGVGDGSTVRSRQRRRWPIRGPTARRPRRAATSRSRFVSASDRRQHARCRRCRVPPARSALARASGRLARGREARLPLSETLYRAGAIGWAHARRRQDGRTRWNNDQEPAAEGRGALEHGVRRAGVATDEQARAVTKSSHASVGLGSGSGLPSRSAQGRVAVFASPCSVASSA